MTATVSLLLALALIALPSNPARSRLDAVVPAARERGGLRVWRPLRTSACTEQCEPLLLAAGWDLLATGMRSGLPVPVVVRAVAIEVDGSARRALGEVADLLALGADAVAAWDPALRHSDTADLGRAARRTARTGSGLAAVAADAASEARAAVGERAEARAQRAGVWVAAPLGLCFLPSFICLGVLPVVAGMVQRLGTTW